MVENITKCHLITTSGNEDKAFITVHFVVFNKALSRKLAILAQFGTFIISGHKGG